MSPTVKQDLQYVWHPFTHLKHSGPPVNIVGSKGAYYFDENNNKYIDAIASWWVNIHGHSHPYIADKIAEQAKQNAHSIFSGFTHPQAALLAERIIKILPSGFSKVFFSDDGSTAVEVALKMALQYFYNRGEKRRKIIAFENAYHGDTFGGMSAGARNVFNLPFEQLLFEVVHIPLPVAENVDVCRNALIHALSDNDVAAFIYEPLVQGAAGMIMYESVHLDELIRLCRERQVICIADEVMTGFGRTGKMFASEFLNEAPDIICLSKGLTGGFMPLGLTVCAQFIYGEYIQEDRTKTFFHGHSYTGNPLACAAANASLDLFEKENTIEKIMQISALHNSFLKKAGEIKGWEIRQKGTILAFEFKGEPTEYLSKAGEKAAAFLFEKGILIRPLGNVFYLLPPYCITKEDLLYIYSVIEEFLNQHAE